MSKFIKQTRKTLGQPPGTLVHVGEIYEQQTMLSRIEYNAERIAESSPDPASALVHGLPDSVLWLLASNPAAARNLQKEAAGRGIEPRRLIFAPKLPLDRHLGRMAAADLFLDTLPYNAHTTSSDALWVGLPVLTCAGATFASRVAGSLLHAIGLPELVTESMDQYERLALRLAREPAHLDSLRQRLRQNRSTAMLFDTERFTRGLESAYLRMWSSFLAGVDPGPIEL